MKAYGAEDLVDKQQKQTACERGAKKKRALRRRARQRQKKETSS